MDINPRRAQDDLYGKGQGPPMLWQPPVSVFDDASDRPPHRNRRRWPRKRPKTTTTSKEDVNTTLFAPSMEALHHKLKEKRVSMTESNLFAGAIPGCGGDGYDNVHGFPRDLTWRALGAYSLLRTLSVPLRLSPFTPLAFLRALYLPVPNPLLGEVHVSLLRILLPHLQMGYTYRERGSGSSTSGSGGLDVRKRRHVDHVHWPLRAGDNLTFLDGLTWPLFYDDYCHLTADRLWASLYGTESCVDFDSDIYDVRNKTSSHGTGNVNVGAGLSTDTLEKMNFWKEEDENQHMAEAEADDVVMVDSQAGYDDEYEIRSGDLDIDDDEKILANQKRKHPRTVEAMVAPTIADAINAINGGQAVTTSTLSGGKPLDAPRPPNISSAEGSLSESLQNQQSVLPFNGSEGQEDAESHSEPMRIRGGGNDVDINKNDEVSSHKSPAGRYYGFRRGLPIHRAPVAHSHRQPGLSAGQTNTHVSPNGVSPQFRVSGTQPLPAIGSDPPLVVPDATAKALRDFIAGKEISSELVSPINDDDDGDDDNTHCYRLFSKQDDAFKEELAAKHWCHFKPLESMRVEVPYHRLSVERKLNILEFLIDELLSVDAISAHFSKRQRESDNLGSLFGDLPSQKDLDELINNDECSVCGLEGDLLCCDGCPGSYHKHCVGISSSDEMGEGKWFCPECKTVDPCNFGSLYGCQKSSVDWVTIKLKPLAPTTNQQLSVGQTSPTHGSIQLLVIHGYVFKSKDDFSTPPTSLTKAALHQVLTRVDERLNWPLAQIPGLVLSHSRYLNSAQTFDPMSYNNKYSSAPITVLFKAGADTQSLKMKSYEMVCSAAETVLLSESLIKDLTLDAEISAILKCKISLFNPYHPVSSYLLRIESNLSRACVVSPLWERGNLTSRRALWFTAVRQARSMQRLAHLLLQLAAVIHPRAFVQEWFQNSHSKLSNSPRVGLSREDRNFVPLPDDWTMEKELLKRQWETTPTDLILRLCSPSDLRAFASQLRSDIFIAKRQAPARSKRKRAKSNHCPLETPLSTSQASNIQRPAQSFQSADSGATIGLSSLPHDKKNDFADGGVAKVVAQVLQSIVDKTVLRSTEKQDLSVPTSFVGDSELTEARQAVSAQSVQWSSMVPAKATKKRKREPRQKKALPLSRRSTRGFGRLLSVEPKEQPSPESNGVLLDLAVTERLQGMALQTEVAKKRHIGGLEKLAKGLYSFERHWPIAGRSIFPTQGKLSPEDMKRLSRQAGIARAPYLEYDSNHEVAQVCNSHVWRKRVEECAGFEELLLLVRMFHSSLDHDVIQSCEHSCKRNKSSIAKVVRRTTRNSTTGQLDHFVMKKNSLKGYWVSSECCDQTPLVVDNQLRRNQIMDARRERLRAAKADADRQKAKQWAQEATAKREEERLRQVERQRQGEEQRRAEGKDNGELAVELKKVEQERAQIQILLQQQRNAELKLGIAELEREFTEALKRHGNEMVQLLKDVILRGSALPVDDIVAVRTMTLATLNGISTQLQKLTGSEKSRQQLMDLLFACEKETSESLHAQKLKNSVPTAVALQIPTVTTNFITSAPPANGQAPPAVSPVKGELATNSFRPNQARSAGSYSHRGAGRTAMLFEPTPISESALATMHLSKLISRSQLRKTHQPFSQLPDQALLQALQQSMNSQSDQQHGTSRFPAMVASCQVPSHYRSIPHGLPPIAPFPNPPYQLGPNLGHGMSFHQLNTAHQQLPVGQQASSASSVDANASAMVDQNFLLQSSPQPGQRRQSDAALRHRLMQEQLMRMNQQWLPQP